MRSNPVNDFEGDTVPIEVLTIYADYVSAWGWINPDDPQHGGAVLPVGYDDHWDGQPALPPELIRRCAAWASEFSWTPFDQSGNPILDWADFHQRGRALANEIKQALGPDVRVIYEKAWEDPDHDHQGRWEALGNDEFLELPSMPKQ